jgi:hypothetical protein
LFVSFLSEQGLKAIGVYHEKHCYHGQCIAPDGHITPKSVPDPDEHSNPHLWELFDGCDCVQEPRGRNP